MGILLRDLLNEVEYTIVKGNLDQEVMDILYDSRKVTKDTAFVCMVGAVKDGHEYISDVIKKGATVIVTERPVEVPQDVTVICTPSTRKALALMSAAFFGYPARKMTTVGITGTKGKTTVAHMIRTILEKMGEPFGIIGTIGAYINGTITETNNTTPESYELQHLFSQMVDAGVHYMIMEVSSQGLKLDRTAGIDFDYGVFVNIYPDHIGPAEHADFDEYLACKAKLFTQCKKGILNIDADHIDEVKRIATCDFTTFGTDKGADYVASNIAHVADSGSLSMGFQISGRDTADAVVGLPGRFNVSNALCAFTICRELGISKDNILKGLRHVHVKGRVEPVKVSDDYTLLIDYAHNEVSCRSVLETLREYNPKRLVSIFGCGGNRAKMRRYTMGEAIGELSDLSIITADNSRFENVMDIIEDIKVGMKKSGGEYVTIPDRQEAVTYAIRNAQKGDMIILLGKGHEEYQEVNGVKHHFSEHEAIERAVKEVYGRDL